MLGKFFKPDWQHAKAEKRIKAISKLCVENAEDQTVLSQLALSDQDASVRLTATEKLVNLELLIKISKRDTVKSNQEHALHRISQILLSQSEPPGQAEKSAALSTLQDSNFLTHIALNSPDETLRTQAVSQLNNDSSLAIIAENSQRASTRVQAAEKISTVELLEALCRSARHKDKGVFKTAKDKLQQLRHQAKQEHERNAHIEKLIQAITHLSNTAYFPLYSAKLHALLQEWQPLGPEASIEQQQAFEQASLEAQAVISAREALEKQAATQESQKQHLKEQSAALYAEICALKESTSSLILSLADLDSLHNKLNQIMASWEDVQDYSTEDNRIAFAKTAAQINNLIAAYRIFFESKQHISELTSALNESTAQNGLGDKTEKAQKTLARLSWPKSHPKPEPISRLESALECAHQQLTKQNSRTRELQSELASLLDELNTAIQNGETRTANKQIKRAEQLSKRLNGSLTPDLEQRIKTLSGELQEILDWQSYAVTPKKESLCAEMEALGNSDIPVQEKANQVKRIQKEWKLLDATDATHSQQLWKRFKAASDTAYAPCDRFFAEQRQMRLNNLKERERICAELEQLSPPQDSEALEWKAYESSIRDAKQAWRTFSPVDRAPGKHLQARFDAILSAQEAPLKAMKQRNAALKSDLIAEAQRILNAEDMTGATRAIKGLQQEWKLIGQAPRNQDRKLWSQFREICSEVFERYYNSPQPGRTVDSDNAQLIGLCDDLEEMIQRAYSLKLLESKLNQAKSLCTDAHSSASPRIEAIEHFVTEQKKALEKFEEALDKKLRQKADLCEQLEQAILEQNCSETISAIREKWPQSTSSSPLDQRFAVLVSLAERPEQMETILNEQELRLRQLCIRLEIASAQASPPEDQTLRMEYQLERLQQALEEQGQGFNFIEVKQLELEWLSIPFARHFGELSERFEDQLHSLL